MTSKEALILLLQSYFGDERAKRKVNKYYDEIENQLLTDIVRLEELEKENKELKAFKKSIIEDCRNIYIQFRDLWR